MSVIALAAFTLALLGATTPAQAEPVGTGPQVFVANEGASRDWVEAGVANPTELNPQHPTCQNVVQASADPEQVDYSVRLGQIGQGITPGVVTFFSRITTTVPNQFVTVSQSNTSVNNAALFEILDGQARLWQGDCSTFTLGTVSGGGTGASFTIAFPGEYVIEIEYSTNSIAGTTAPVPADIIYNFTTSLGGSTGASVDLVYHPRQPTCQTVVRGTANPDQVDYSVKLGRIDHGITPGVVTFFSRITTTVPNQVVTVSQSNTSLNNAALFKILDGQVRLWQGDCSTFTLGTGIGDGSQASFTIAVPGEYVIEIRYPTKSIDGTTAPVPADIIYNFTTSLGGLTGATVDLIKK